jgi:hypothetical protein
MGSHHGSLTVDRVAKLLQNSVYREELRLDGRTVSISDITDMMNHFESILTISTETQQAMQKYLETLPIYMGHHKARNVNEVEATFARFSQFVGENGSTYPETLSSLNQADLDMVKVVFWLQFGISISRGELSGNTIESDGKVSIPRGVGLQRLGTFFILATDKAQYTEIDLTQTDTGEHNATNKDDEDI